MSIPGAASPLFLATTGAAEAFEISRSLRFNSADSASLSRTPSSASNRKTWTWSGWVKRSDISSTKTIWASSTLSSIRFATNSEIEWLYEGSYGLKTNAVFRDISAWYHFVFVLDTTNATADDRQKIYVNGTQLTSFASRGNPSLNSDKQWNAASAHAIGAKPDASVEFDGYLAEINFIDGQALDPTSFGKFDDNGVWQAIDTAGLTFGTNGFRLKFADNSSDAALGTDSSGNSNTWTVNNLTVGAAINPTAKQNFDVLTYTGNGGTQKLGGVSYSNSMDSGITSGSNIFNGSLSSGGYFPGSGTNIVLTTTPFTINTSLRVYQNFRSDGTYAICLNNSCINVAGSGTNSAVFRWSTVDLSSFTLPLDVTKLGYSLSQNSGNTIMAIEVDGSILIDGTGPGFQFQPDFVWLKKRSGVADHYLYDTVRGATNRLYSNTTDAESTSSTGLTAFTSNGFILGNANDVNQSSNTYVAWGWKAGGAAVSNTDGTITSSVSANTSYGFSIVTFNSGSSDGDFTCGHGLNSAPELIIMKSRSRSGGPWWVYHADATNATTKYLQLSETAAVITNSGGNIWGSSLPTNSVFGFSVGAGKAHTQSETVVSYCWSEVAGFSKFGSYTGGTNNNTITLGFKPRYLLIKVTNTSDSWLIYDSERHPGNPVDDFLQANNAEAEATGNSNAINFLADGFQLASTQGGTNGSGNTYIYAAFAATNLNQPGIDSLVDTPTNAAEPADTGVGGEVIGNHCTWNPLDNAGTLANGNLDFSQASAAFRNVRSTFAVSSGKWYWEGTVGALGGAAYIGIGTSAASLTVNIGASNTFGYVNSGNKQSNNTAEVSYGASYTTGDVIGVAFDADAGTLTFYKNGSSQGQAYSGLTSGPYFFMVTGYNGTTWNANFGQRGFVYAATSNHKALNTANLPTPTIPDGRKYFDAKTYQGNGGSQAVVLPGGFSPDLVWIKNRSRASFNVLFDIIRGPSTGTSSSTNKALASDASDAEGLGSSIAGLTAFNSDGFTLDSNQIAPYNATGPSTEAYIAWAWDAGTSTVTNNDGSIASQVRANPSAGFSIVTYTATGSVESVGHGLNDVPALTILKNRDAAGNWIVYTQAIDGSLDYLNLNTTGAKNDSGNTAPTSSVVYLGGTNNQDHVAYCFAPVAGYSAFGSYTGNGSADGTFVYTNFKPKFLLWKNTSGVANWYIYDSARSTYNVVNLNLEPNTSDAENTLTSMNVDFLSNGYKIRGSDGDINGSGSTYVYAAFAENPFQANGGLAR